VFHQKRLEVALKRHVHTDQDPGADTQAEPHALVMRVSDTDGESAPRDKERLQIQHAEHLHAVFGNSVFLLKHADLAKAEAFHQLWFPQIPIILIDWELSLIIRLPFGHLFPALIASLSASFRSRAALQLEILALRHQLGVLQRSVKRSKLTPADRLLWAWLRRVWQDWQSGVFVMKAATVLGSHRKGFRLFWRWKIRHGKPGRPAVPKEIRELIRMMSRENPLLGRSRIYGELLKLGIEIGETGVSKYMVRCRRPPPQTWKTFLESHVKSMVSVDFFSPGVPGSHDRFRRGQLVSTSSKLHQLLSPEPDAFGLAKDSREPRPVQPPGAGRIIAIPEVGGLHHRYERRAA
jgi:hypothetical protein